MLVFPRILELLRQQSADHITLIGGGAILPREIRELKALGAAELWGVDSSTDDIVSWIRHRFEADG